MSIPFLDLPYGRLYQCRLIASPVYYDVDRFKEGAFICATAASLKPAYGELNLKLIPLGYNI